MKDKKATVTITLNLHTEEAEALEIFCHRFEARHLVGIATGQKEAQQMIDAIRKLAAAISGAQ